ncbi:MAG: hypothetical protein H7Z41_20075 [Cytophagales bacterium]|nr:hypothetical protein [Armatimonadota bacterium]
MSEYPCGGTRREQELMLYAGGELLFWDRQRVERHLRHCSCCCERHALIRSAMGSIAAEVRGSSLPAWQAQSPVPSYGIAARLLGRREQTARLASLAAISAAVAAVGSYLAANYGDNLRPVQPAPPSPVSIVTSPICR